MVVSIHLLFLNHAHLHHYTINYCEISDSVIIYTAVFIYLWIYIFLPYINKDSEVVFAYIYSLHEAVTCMQYI